MKQKQDHSFEQIPIKSAERPLVEVTDSRHQIVKEKLTDLDPLYGKKTDLTNFRCFTLGVLILFGFIMGFV
jgi:hypothetical protein